MPPKRTRPIPPFEEIRKRWREPHRCHASPSQRVRSISAAYCRNDITEEQAEREMTMMLREMLSEVRERLRATSEGLHDLRAARTDGLKEDLMYVERALEDCQLRIHGGEEGLRLYRVKLDEERRAENQNYEDDRRERMRIELEEMDARESSRARGLN